MHVSDEQMAAVMHGLPGKNPTYEWVDLPVGPQPIPQWARGLHIDWMDNYANDPWLTVKTHTDFQVTEWPNQVFTKYGSRYLSESGDGRARCYYHDGELKLRPLRAKHKFLTVYANPVPRNKHGHVDLDHYFPMHWSKFDVTCWATTQDRGFGGDNIGITLDDGRKAVLRGPWCGASPPGYIQCATTRGACYISEELLILLIAKHYAHCRVARVTEYGRTRIQPVREDWDEPKAWVEARKRSR